MKSNYLILMAGVILLCLPPALVFAGDSVSISMSCTIPAIPGVNVPLVEEAAIKILTDEPSVQQINAPQSETQPEPSVIQEDTPEEKTINKDEGQSALAMVTTFYSR